MYTNIHVFHAIFGRRDSLISPGVFGSEYRNDILIFWKPKKKKKCRVRRSTGSTLRIVPVVLNGSKRQCLSSARRMVVVQ